jgi:hypothetical protein
LTTHKNTHAHPQPPPAPSRESQPAPTPKRAGTTVSMDQRGYPDTCLQKIARCSRPLCSSQSTEDHPPHDTARPQPAPRRDTLSGTTSRQVSVKSQPRPPPRQWRTGPAPSGPNSVPTTRPPAPTTFHTPASRRTPAPY